MRFSSGSRRTESDTNGFEKDAGFSLFLAHHKFRYLHSRLFCRSENRATGSKKNCPSILNSKTSGRLRVIGTKMTTKLQTRRTGFVLLLIIHSRKEGILLGVGMLWMYPSTMHSIHVHTTPALVSQLKGVVIHNIFLYYDKLTQTRQCVYRFSKPRSCFINTPPCRMWSRSCR
jgi:hypothetical protein